METQRLKPLRDWIDRIEARCMYEAHSPNKHMLVSFYVVGGKFPVGEDLAGPRTFVVTTHLNHHGAAIGWDVYVPASFRNDVGATLDGAALALGVEGCRGLVEADGPEGAVRS